jgi:LysR family glycine cleavage system transcriptional activator
MDQDDRRLLPSITMLQCFEAAARYGSASLAATRIGLTQSAVSRHIASLETWLGKPLFDRVGRRIVLNEQGRLYLDRIARPLGEIRAATRDMLGHGAGRVVNLATLPTFGMRWIAPRLPGLLMHDPELVVNIAARTDIFAFSGRLSMPRSMSGRPTGPMWSMTCCFARRSSRWSRPLWHRG